MVLRNVLLAAAQITELGHIKAAVAELETSHHKARQLYEEELQKLRLENQALRTAAAQASTPSSWQIPSILIIDPFCAGSMSNVDRSAGPSYQGDYNRDDRNAKRPKQAKEPERHGSHLSCFSSLCPSREAD